MKDAKLVDISGTKNDISEKQVYKLETHNIRTVAA
jgi:hypothetical protein